jgi:ribosome maturation factor RimP
MEREQIEQIIGNVVAEEGLSVFDVVLPKGRRGTLRVYIYRSSPQRTDVGHNECVLIAKKILDLDVVEEIIPGQCTLEVSTPGINRRLRTIEHFTGARGERIRVTFTEESGQSAQVIGVLDDVVNDVLVLRSENKGEVCSIPFSRISQARVNFPFD